MSLTAKLQAKISANENVSLDLGEAALPLLISASEDFTDGTGAGKVQQLFSDQRTLEASANEELDLVGDLKNAFGQTLTFTAIKGIYIKAAAGNTNNVEVGGAVSNAFQGPLKDASDVVVLPPGGVLFCIHPGAGWAVTSGTGDLLKVANDGSGTGVTYDVVLIGEGTAA